MERHLLYVPGLEVGDKEESPISQRVLSSWQSQGYEVQEINLHWGDGKAFSVKLSHLLKVIDELAAEKKKIFLLGVSAGASAALNAYAARRNSVAGVAAIAGWLKARGRVPPSVEKTHGHSRAFLESVRLFGKRVGPRLQEADWLKIVTLRPQKDTEVISPDLSIVEGATNIELPIKGHARACLAAFTQAGTIAEFFASK